MTHYRTALEELVTANRILAHEGVVDAFGHASIRHPENPQRYILSRARAPECIEVDDLMEFTLEGEALDARGRKGYAERHIHGAIYKNRPDVNAIVHTHSPNVIPFTVTRTAIRPLFHMAARIGSDVPLWDSCHHFGDTNLLVTNMEMGQSLADALGDCRAALMRGHGCVVTGEGLREAVFDAIYLDLNADLQLKASGLGDITFLSDGEVAEIMRSRSSFSFERAWERWCERAGRPYEARPLEGPLAS